MESREKEIEKYPTDNCQNCKATMINPDNWQTNFEALKAHVAQTGHFPNKHTRLNNWCRYQRKRIKAGTIPIEQKTLFEALAASRSGEHTGGRKKKVELHGNS